MALFALILGLFLAPYTFFNVGGSTPTSGLGDVIQGPPATRGTATLTVKTLQPVATIVGTGFKPHENVRLMGVTTKRVRASATGRFTVRIRGADPCNGISISAVGAKGSHASLNYSQLLCVEP
jgi:hypothetical protein